MAGEVEAELVLYLACLLGQSVLLYQRHHGALHRRDGSREMHHHARVATLQGLVLVAGAHHAQEHTVHADRCLDDVGNIALVQFRIEVLYLLAAEFLMLRQVEVGARVYALHLLESERHHELDVGGGVGVVSQLLVVVVAVFLVAQAQVLVPLQTHLAPIVEPLHLRAGAYEELHLHLLELAHAEYELTRHDLVAERLAYLRDTERDAHTARLLHVQVIHENALSGLGTQVHVHRAVGRGAHLGLEHQVELTHVGPVARAADGVCYLVVQDYLLQLVEVVGVHGVRVTLVQLVALGLMLQYARVGLAEHSLVERLAETLSGLGHLLVNLLVEFGNLVLYQHVGAVALLAVAVVYKRIVERVHVARCLPDGGVHEDGRVDAHDVVVKHGHCLPPVTLDVVLEFHTVLAVVVHSRQTVVYLR